MIPKKPVNKRVRVNIKHPRDTQSKRNKMDREIFKKRNEQNESCPPSQIACINKRPLCPQTTTQIENLLLPSSSAPPTPTRKHRKRFVAWPLLQIGILSLTITHIECMCPLSPLSLQALLLDITLLLCTCLFVCVSTGPSDPHTQCHEAKRFAEPLPRRPIRIIASMPIPCDPALLLF